MILPGILLNGYTLLSKTQQAKKKRSAGTYHTGQETITEWDYAKNKWATKTVFKNSSDPFYPKEDISKIDSFYFEGNDHISGLTLSIVFNGGERSIKATGNSLDANPEGRIKKDQYTSKIRKSLSGNDCKKSKGSGTGINHSIVLIPFINIPCIKILMKNSINILVFA